MPLRSARPAVLAICLLAAFGGLQRVGAQSAEESFRRGLEIFDAAAKFRADHPTRRTEIAARFQDAAAAFVEAWRGGATSSEVLTNAANSYFFAGAAGEAALHYSRALAVDPANEVARAGLDELRSKLPIRAGRDRASASLTSSLLFWHEDSTFRIRLWVFWIGFPLAWLLFLAEILRRRSSFFGPCALLGWAALITSSAALASLAWDGSERDPSDRAVVLVEVIGHNGDGDIYKPSHYRPGSPGEPIPFPPGTELRVREIRTTTDGEWLDVELLDGSSSWVPARAVEWVIPRAE